MPAGQMKANYLSGSSGNHNRELGDDNSSTTSEKYERDVAILNHCFDDIERFIAHLQSAAQAYRELELRRRNRKNRRKDHGEGILSMRARPPPERDFMDVLQKFKLSFNLLAKLKSHIHDPNAPELVHFLFTPLALIVDASRDSNYGNSLASRVVSPLLTRDAAELLTNCLTSKESDLWYSLGDAWVTPREQWKGYVAPYHPIFADGWAPEYPFGDEKDDQGPESEFRGSYYGNDRTSSPVVREVERETRSELSADSIERIDGGGGGGDDPQRQWERRQRQWLGELVARDARIVQVTYPRTANNDRELTIFRGEFLEVLDDSRKWWKARNMRDNVGHVPCTIVTPYQPGEEDFLVGPSGYRQESPIDGGSERSIPRAPPLPAPTPASAEWVRRERQGKKDIPAFPNRQNSDSSSLDSDRYSDKNPSPVPPPTPPKPILNKTQSVYVLPDDGTGTNVFHEELKHKLTIGRLSQNKLAAIPRPQGSKSHFTVNSTPEEVSQSLRNKGFSERVVRILNGMSGEDLFFVDNADLIKACGKNEGNRLVSHITLQKSISGYKTIRSKELKDKLAARRARVDESNETVESAAPRPQSVSSTHSGSGGGGSGFESPAPSPTPPPPPQNHSAKREEPQMVPTPQKVPIDFNSDEEEGDGLEDEELAMNTLRNRLRQQRAKVLHK